MKKWILAGCLALSFAVLGCAEDVSEQKAAEEKVAEEKVAIEETAETEETTAEEESTATTVFGTERKEFTFLVENPSWEYYCGEDGAAEAAPGIRLEKTGEKPNEITDLDVWQQENGITIPKIPYSDEDYAYEYEGEAYKATNLLIQELSADGKTWRFDFTEFSMPEEYNVEYVDFLNEGIYYARIQDEVLYVATGHNTYSEWAPHTGYITAVDLESGEVLWKTEPRICNSDNFVIIGDSIVCGYGFTSEDDFLYILDRSDGRWIERIPLASAVDYIVKKEDMLYVRTYNTDYEFKIGINEQEGNP